MSDEQRKSGKSVGTAAVVAVFAALLAWVAWGYFGESSKALRPVAAAVSAPPLAVATTPSTTSAATPAATPVPVAAAADEAAALAPGDERGTRSGVRGVVKAKEEVLFSAKIAARIASMPYKEGERFAKGSLLVGFDCSRLRAEANAAWAANRASRQIERQSVELDTYQAIGKSEVKVAQAKAEQTGAEAAALESQVRDCTITAPFSGIVVEKMAHEHETAAPGAQLTRVLNDSDLELHLIAPSSWLSWLKQGSTFAFRIDETGRSYAARVARLGAAVDPVSQTVKVVGLISGSREAVLPGMSGTADFAEAATPRKMP